jgi:SAM-dependent methyltransferase
MSFIKAPKPLKAHARALRFGFKSLVSLFGRYHPRLCTVCGHEGRFFSYGYPLTADVVCPKCLSLERHRAIAIFDKERDPFRGRDILHFAPEAGLSELIRNRSPKSYKTCDGFASGVDLRIDITSIDLPDCSFDLVICLHVLEHVDDDRKAMAEVNRILRPSGAFIVMVPIEEGWDETYENPAIVSPEQRLLHFGQEDHVRFYGRDIRDRLAAVGFKVSEWTAQEPQVSRHGLRRGEKIFYCEKLG